MAVDMKAGTVTGDGMASVLAVLQKGLCTAFSDMEEDALLGFSIRALSIVTAADGACLHLDALLMLTSVKRCEI